MFWTQALSHSLRGFLNKKDIKTDPMHVAVMSTFLLLLLLLNVLYTIISLFFVMEIFSEGTR